MAICLHKLVNRASVIKPILLQSRQIATPSFIVSHQIESKTLQSNVLLTKPTLLNVDTQALTRNVRYFSNTKTNFNQETGSSGQSSTEGGASEEQLSIIYETLREDLPQIFVKPLDYSNVHKDIVFENRIRGKTYYGIVETVKQISMLRLYGHFMFAYVKMDVIKMTKHTEDSSIKVRWRISGITGYRILFKMIQFRVWDPKLMIEQHQKPWLDGFSTVYVNSDGLVIRHIADKVMPDQDRELNPIEKAVGKLGNIPKLALYVNLSADIAPTVT